MSAMANVLLALLALVLCASQANAAQPATNQSCAETKKSLEDGGLAEITVDSFPAFNWTLRQSFCDGYWHNVGGSAQSAKAWSACSSVLKNAVSVGKARCPAPVYVDKNYKAPKGKRIVRKVFTTKHVIKSQQVHVSQCIDFNLLGSSYSAHVQRQNYQKSFVRYGVPSFASVKYSKPPPPGCTVLFQASGHSGKFDNQWFGWYSAGSTVNSGSGKRAAYDQSPVSSLRLSDASGRFVEYKLNKGYAGRTLLSIVQGCMGSIRYNTDTSAWRAGLCSNVGTRTSSSGSFTGGSVSSVLRIGVGEGQNAANDWAWLMPLSGNGQGDYHGANVWAFGGEQETNNGYSGTVTISACSGTTAKSTGYWQVVSGAAHCQIVDGGRCVTDGAGNYGNSESCRVIALRPFYVYTKQYQVEKGWDYLTVNGKQYKSNSAPNGVKMGKGAALQWKSDSFGTNPGWKVCAQDHAGVSTAAAGYTTAAAGTTAGYAGSTAGYYGTTAGYYGTTAGYAATTHATAGLLFGNAGSNSCSQGTLVNTEAECKEAARQMSGSNSFQYSFSSSSRPKGCWRWTPTGRFYFKPHSTGGGSSYARPVCKVGGGKAGSKCQTRADWTLGFPITDTSYMDKVTNLYSSEEFSSNVTSRLGFRVQRANASWTNIEEVKFHDDIKYQLVEYEPFAPRTNQEFRHAARQCSWQINCTLEGPYGPMEDWDVSDVTTMNQAFYDAYSFNADISNWDVSNVRNMYAMFDGARRFNVDISKWNVAKVTNMNYMFYMATSFNVDLSSWNVWNVTSVHGMFTRAYAFNVDLSSWNVWKVADVSSMFYQAYAFNQKLCSPAWLRVQNELSNTTKYTFLSSSGKISCEKDRFAPESRKELDAALSACFEISSDGNCAKGKYNKRPAIGDWDVSDVQDLSYLFYQKSNFKADISKWNVANATDMEGMFAYAQ